MDQLGLTWLIALLNWLFSFDSDRIGEHQADADGNDMINDNQVGPAIWDSPVLGRTKRWAGQ